MIFYSSGEKRINDTSNSKIAGLDEAPAKKKKNKHKNKWEIFLLVDFCK